MKNLGYALLAVGALWLLGSAAVFLSGAATGETSLPASLLGIVMFGGPLAVALGIAGVVLVTKGRREADMMAEAKFEGSVLNMVETRGTVTLDEMATDLGCTVARVEEALRNLVGKHLFTGFINWKARRVYSEAAAALNANTCPNCGGKLDLAGKDLVACPYCGTEIFLDRD